MNVILVGYRGTGKSTVAALLSQLLGLPLVGFDAELVRRAGRTIPELVAAEGWDHFRALEQALVAEMASGTGRVLDCGGGVVERHANVVALRGSGTVFWLTARTATIVERIAGGTDRPALVEGMSFTDEVSSVLERRKPLYAALAHVRIETDERTPEQVARLVQSLWPHCPIEQRAT